MVPFFLVISLSLSPCFKGPSRLKLSKPVIGAIEGHAVAGGMELALICDLRVAAENTVMGIFNRRFGNILFNKMLLKKKSFLLLENKSLL